MVWPLQNLSWLPRAFGVYWRNVQSFRSCSPRWDPSWCTYAQDDYRYGSYVLLRPCISLPSLLLLCSVLHTLAHHLFKMKSRFRPALLYLSFTVWSEEWNLSNFSFLSCVANRRLERNFLEDSQVSAQLNLKIFELSVSHINHYEIKMAGSRALWENHILVQVKFPQEVCRGLYGGEVTQRLYTVWKDYQKFKKKKQKTQQLGNGYLSKKVTYK